MRAAKLAILSLLISAAFALPVFADADLHSGAGKLAEIQAFAKGL